jgi:DNA-binding MltR family transcriptional regulator
MGPLATFSAKIKLAYSLGLISKVCFTDLEKIRRIRNIASHEYSETTFERPDIIEINRTLDGADEMVPYLPVSGKERDPSAAPPSDPPLSRVKIERFRFILSVFWIAVKLEKKGKWLAENLRRGSVDPEKSWDRRASQTS